MKHAMKRLIGQVLAFALVLSVCLAPAQALTPDELKTLLQEIYIDEVGDAVLSQDTIEGILEALGDPYTRYMTAEEFKQLMESMSDMEIGGIGISASAAEDGLLIMSVHEGSPAEKAGLEVGDTIIAVDGNDAKGVDASVVTQWLRGEIGSKVDLTIRRAGGSTAKKTLERALIVIPSTESELLGDHIGYLNCTNFGDTTLKHFQEAMDTHKDAAVWMVDLRSNTGGDVNATVQTLGLFLGTGNIAYMRNGKDQYMVFQSQQDTKTMYPTIVLTSEWTASAAEIFSGVIRDGETGLVIGEKTFGKGVAQAILTKEEYPQYFADGDAMAITAFRYYTPDGNTADQIGIIPHLLVDAEIAADIGILLSAVEPADTTANTLRLNIGYWRWYVDLELATKEEVKPYFAALLEALPPGTVIKLGTGGDAWRDASIEELVNTYQLTTYQSRWFTDAGTGARADKLNTLATYDLLNGYEDGSFRPDGTMTRAEFCALLVQAMGLHSKGAAPFTDVPEDAWFAEAVSAVHAAGLMNGTGDGLFSPSGTVSKEEMITVMGRASAMLNTFLHEKAKEWDPAASHVPAAFSGWAKPWVWLLSESQKNILGGPLNLLADDPATLNPAQPATRGETAELLYNIYTHLGILRVTE